MKIAFKKEEFGICTLGDRKKKGTVCAGGGGELGEKSFL